MRRLVALFLASMLSLSVSAAGQSGVNQSLSSEELEASGISSLEYPDVILTEEDPAFSYGDSMSNFVIGIVLENDSNVTSADVITQVCINTGVCFAPETKEMESDGMYFVSLFDVVEDASYINWKFVLHHENGSSTDVPEVGFGWKVWSNCWWDNGTWGGPSTHCQEGEESSLPGFAAPAAAAAIVMAALMARRD